MKYHRIPVTVVGLYRLLTNYPENYYVVVDDSYASVDENLNIADNDWETTVGDILDQIHENRGFTAEQQYVMYKGKHLYGCYHNNGVVYLITE